MPMRTLISLVVLALFAARGSGQTFADFLEQVTTAPESLRTAIVDSFVTANPVSPVFEFDTLAHYYYRGTVTSVTIPGDANQWNPAMFPMARLSTTNFWYRTEAFEPDARLDYKYFLNGSTWILDPRNPYTVTGGFGPNSELRMPEFVQPPEIAYYSGIPHGTLRDTLFFSTNLGNSRTIRVYTPPSYGSPLDSFAVVVFHDGLEYVSLGSAANVLDYLIHHGRIDPLIAVFVPPVNRTEEYAGSLQDEFTAFIVDELMPWVDARYTTRLSPGSRATLGASNGGNIALWLGLNHPEVFGNIAAHSSNIQGSISDGFENGPLLDLRLYMDLGTYDIPILITLVRDFIPILQARGYDHTYIEFHDGHSWGNWRGHIDNALEMFFPGPALGVNEQQAIPAGFTLQQNYPNPFNPKTTIVYSVEKTAFVGLRIHNILGQEVATLVNEMKGPGRYEVTWDATGFASGTYLCRYSAGGFTSTRRMLLLR
jgi:enterochelin esterase family protein